MGMGMEMGMEMGMGSHIKNMELTILPPYILHTNPVVLRFEAILITLTLLTRHPLHKSLEMAW